MRLDWNAFHRGLVASDGPRSVVTEDPETPEAMALRMYARTAPLRANAILEKLASSIPERKFAERELICFEIFMVDLSQILILTVVTPCNLSRLSS
jgi:hypothetical protein